MPEMFVEDDDVARPAGDYVHGNPLGGFPGACLVLKRGTVQQIGQDPLIEPVGVGKDAEGTVRARRAVRDRR
jgi:hypothetical protein